MEENVRFILSRIIMERMELKSTLKEISYLMNTKPDIRLSNEIDRILDRLRFLEIMEQTIRKKI